MERKVKKIWVNSLSAGASVITACYGISVAAAQPLEPEPKQLEKIVIKASPLRTDANNSTVPVSVLS
ncbi:MAG TPA: hypothetical protein DIU11_01220, partial [Pusillimonas sp.]|nr:hypothetical protein [Pusillimonas sp.]